jgi:hypothetical protein
LSSCDPVYDLKLENQSSGTIEVIFSPSIADQHESEEGKISIRGEEINVITLDSGETMKIGTVIARYNPVASDLYLDYLEVRYKQDTIRLTGKNAILSTIQKVEQFDWRVIIK